MKKKEYSNVVFRIFTEQKTLVKSIRETYPGCSVKPFVSEFTSTFIEIIGKNLSSNSCARLIAFIHDFKPQVTVFIDNMEIEEIGDLQKNLSGLAQITYESKCETAISPPKVQDSSISFFQPPSLMELNFYNIIKFLSEDNLSTYTSSFPNSSLADLKMLRFKLEQYISRFKKADSPALPNHLKQNFMQIENFFNELIAYVNSQQTIKLDL